jgi:SAM-dependent methyltransferase
MSDPLSDVVSRQYEKWMYPAPIEDLEKWLVNNWQLMDPSHSHRMFWPDREYQPDVDILIAGCGTNQAAVFAHTNPAAKILAVDISEPSLDHERYLKDKYGLRNLELRQLPIEELPGLGRGFDLIVSSGVLHHMADPGVGIKAFSECVRKDGAIGLMVYGKYGRLGVEIVQGMFRDMGLAQDDESLELVKKMLPWLPPTHPVNAYTNAADDLNFDAGIVDTFLHGRERLYAVDDCIDFVESAGLAFQGWFTNSPYHPHPMVDQSPEIHAAIRRLPKRKIWSVMERARASCGTHNFIACRRDRPKDQYSIDFSAPEALDYVPLWRKACRLDSATIRRPRWQFDLQPGHAALVQQINGRATIREIASGAAESDARALFQNLWRMDFITIAKAGNPEGV